MPFVIGTAGHIDHGKTTLVKALTGQDTDRLKEEKARGISIDLGFAHLDLPDGTRAGIVDVPGHERFIRNMLAGAQGIDLVLFTVAADDGVMPQTEEHFDIVHLLGIDAAIFVITKIDLVSEERIVDVEEQIAVLVAGTALEGSPVVRVSAATGQGIDELRHLIVDRLQRRRPVPPPGYFRMPVDRVFLLAGHGVVVTGTAESGEIHVGDRVRCFPGGEVFRVRNLEVHNEQVAEATWGQRVAVNVSGAEKSSMVRGHVICDERLTMPTERFDATLEVRPSATKGIRNHQRVRVHIGTAERMAKVVLLGGRDVAVPTQPTCCQIVLVEPVLALRGDRFIIRDETARGTIGGGVLLNPWPRVHRRRDDAEQRLAELQRADLPAAAAWFLADREAFAVGLAPVYQFLNVRADEAAAALARGRDVRTIALEGETFYTTEAKWRALQDRLTAALREFHDAHPLVAGREMEEVRARLSDAISPKVFRAVVEHLARVGTIVREGSLLRDPAHSVTLGEGEQQAADRIAALLEPAGLAPPDLKQLEEAVGLERGKLIEVLRVLERERRVVRVAPDLYYLRETVDDLRRALVDAFGGDRALTPAAFRDRFGTSRKYAIPLLEYFDHQGVTIRMGDVRRVRKETARARGEGHGT